MTKRVKNQSPATNPLVGKFAHTFFEDGLVHYQVRIAAEPKPGFYLVEFYEWAMGYSTSEKLFTIEEMKGWTFYNTEERWRECGDQLMKVVMAKHHPDLRMDMDSNAFIAAQKDSKE